MRKLLIFIVFLAATMIAVTPASASSDSVSVSSLGGGICQATFISVPVHIATTFTNPTPFSEAFTVNGIGVGSIAGTQSAGTLSYTGNLGSNFPTQNFPYLYRSVTQLGSFTVSVTGQCSGSGATPVVTVSVTSGSSFWDPGDDRLNRDAGQPAALYCRNGGDVQVWRIDPITSLGKLSFTATKLEIATVKNSKPAHNTLIKASADGAFKLYYLPASDELSFISTYPSSGKPYYFVFKGCS